jgi:hypothetical protein
MRFIGFSCGLMTKHSGPDRRAKVVADRMAPRLSTCRPPPANL